MKLSIFIFAAAFAVFSAGTRTEIVKTIKSDTSIVIKCDTSRVVTNDTLKVTKTYKDTTVFVKQDTVKATSKPVKIQK